MGLYPLKIRVLGAGMSSFVGECLEKRWERTWRIGYAWEWGVENFMAHTGPNTVYLNYDNTIGDYG